MEKTIEWGKIVGVHGIKGELKVVPYIDFAGLFEKAEERFTAFLKSLSPTELKAEYVLPVLVDQLMHEDGLKVDVLSTDAVWFGVTYHEDKPYVQAELKKMHDDGTYPEKLF